MKKWGNQSAEEMNQKELPENQTHLLCNKLLEDQDQGKYLLSLTYYQFGKICYILW